MSIGDGNALFYYMKEMPLTFKHICNKYVKNWLTSCQSKVMFVSTDLYSTSLLYKSSRMQMKGSKWQANNWRAKHKKPNDWTTFLCNEENKQQLVKLLYKVWTNDEITKTFNGRTFILVKEGKEERWSQHWHRIKRRQTHVFFCIASMQGGKGYESIRVIFSGHCYITVVT